MSWIQVYSASNSLEAHSLKGMLESEGIRVMLKGESLSSATGELPADVLAVTLWVDIAREAWHEKLCCIMKRSPALCGFAVIARKRMAETLRYVGNVVHRALKPCDH